MFAGVPQGAGDANYPDGRNFGSGVHRGAQGKPLTPGLGRGTKNVCRTLRLRRSTAVRATFMGAKIEEQAIQLRSGELEIIISLFVCRLALHASPFLNCERY